MWRANSGVIHCVHVFDQIPNLPNCFTTPNKNLETWEGRGPQIDKHPPPSTFAGQFLRKAEL
jgi:hypothetical protein